jgi:uncharacterized protein YbjT (DUF2867 family)
VTGAAGRTGVFVFKKLLNSDKFYPVAVVRSESSAKKLRKISGVQKDQVYVSDVTQGVDELAKTLKSISGGEETSVIMCTSAVPKIKIFSILKVIALKLIKRSGRPEFYFPPAGTPYEVDYLGAKNQIEAAQKVGVKHFVFLSSMGGTQPENFLNTIGKVEGDEKSGDILLWKRKAEKFLISSGLPYTIVHPGGLTDKKSAKSKIVSGVNDELLKEKVRSIAREDVATVCIQALQQPGAKNKSIDVISRELDDSQPNSFTNWVEFFNGSKSCTYEA